MTNQLYPIEILQSYGYLSLGDSDCTFDPKASYLLATNRRANDAISSRDEYDSIRTLLSNVCVYSRRATKSHR